jgi:hypothetical protein
MNIAGSQLSVKSRSTRGGCKDRVLNVLYRRRAMIARHFQELLCVAHVAFKRIYANLGQLGTSSALGNLMERAAFFEVAQEQVPRLIGQLDWYLHK